VSSLNLATEELMGINVTAKKNGPYLVTGDLSQLNLTDAEGKPYDLTGKQAVALCRCGGSVNKPFCDGTHSKIGFQGAESAVKAQEEKGPMGTKM
jgi:3-phenylpropionate/trans-cinnamate dioxygenase ferredoxin subunit